MIIQKLLSDSMEIEFLSEKIHAHYWPMNTPKWSDSIKTLVDNEINNNKEKQVKIKTKIIQINNFTFTDICKVGLTIPLFQKRFTMVFEGHFDKFYAHVHITSKTLDYLEIFSRLNLWRSRYFSDSVK